MAICGAGCSGLSLAVELFERVPGISITLFDAAEGPMLSKTWCSWSVRPNRFASAVTSSWSRVRVRGAGHDTTIDAGRYPYVCIRAEDFFRSAQQRLGEAARVEWSTDVVSIEDDGRGVEVRFDDDSGTGRAERFDMVFDGRTCRRPAKAGDKRSARHEPVLLQHFGGLEIELPDGSFDPSTAMLMDFDVPQHDGAHFMYVLPFSARRALVESTFLTPPGFRPVDYEANVLEYVRRVFGGSSPRVVYRETGVLPMTLSPLGPPGTARVWPIGTRAGVGRASSGYAFDAIQRDSARVVDALLAGRDRPRVPRPRLLSLLDRVLISWLERDAAVAPLVFGRLFARCRTESLIRFLADEPTGGDLLRTMWAMPKMRTAMHTVSQRAAWPGRVPVDLLGSPA